MAKKELQLLNQYKNKLFKLWIDDQSLLEKINHLRHYHSQTIVTINGCFDLLTPKHVKVLSIAKSQGDILIVGINSDSSIKLLKGIKRPIFTEIERAMFLLELPFVDFVVIYDEKTSENFVARICPDIHANDSSYGINCVEKSILDKFGGKLFIFEKEEEALSTTEIIERILSKSKGEIEND